MTKGGRNMKKLSTLQINAAKRHIRKIEKLVEKLINLSTPQSPQNNPKSVDNSLPKIYTAAELMEIPDNP